MPSGPISTAVTIAVALDAGDHWRIYWRRNQHKARAADGAALPLCYLKAGTQDESECLDATLRLRVRQSHIAAVTFETNLQLWEEDTCR